MKCTNVSSIHSTDLCSTVWNTPTHHQLRTLIISQPDDVEYAGISFSQTKNTTLKQTPTSWLEAIYEVLIPVSIRCWYNCSKVVAKQTVNVNSDTGLLHSIRYIKSKLNSKLKQTEAKLQLTLTWSAKRLTDAKVHHGDYNQIATKRS